MWRSLVSSLCRVTWSTMGKQWAVHWSCSVAGQALQDSVVFIPDLVTLCMRSHLGSWQAEQCQGCHTVPGPQRCSLLAITALAIADHASEGSLTSHPAPAYLHLENGVFWCVMAFLRNAIHLATVGVGVLLPSCLIPENCCMQTANSVLSSWTCGSQNTTTAHI